MANIFNKKSQYTPVLKRNSYDLSKLVNGTYKEGLIYPVNWFEVTFGDSVRVDISAALRTMPMVWPIQTPVLVKFYNFYVRNRTLQKNYTDFRFKNKQVVHPFISQSSRSDFWRTGGIADHMGIPTTVVSQDRRSYVSFENLPHGSFTPDDFSFNKSKVYPVGLPVLSFSSLLHPVSELFTYGEGAARYCWPLLSRPLRAEDFDYNIVIDDELVANPSSTFTVALLVRLPDFGLVVCAFSTVLSLEVVRDGLYSIPTSGYSLTSNFSFIAGSSVSPVVNNGYKGLFNSLAGTAYSTDNLDYYLVLSNRSGLDPVFVDFPLDINTPVVKRGISFGLGQGVSQLSDVSNPFAGSNPQIPINALPFRAYEAIYNSHFRDPIVEPFIIDGEPQYNRFITNDGDGADDTLYELKRRNWESDQFTSAKPSPQQGLAPLVGVSAAGDFEFIDERGSTVRVRSKVADDGDTVTGFDYRTADGSIDRSITRTMVALVDAGFSINALRNTNSYQRWLESNYRLGLRFKEQVLANTGVNLEYKELDMPEFLGGFTVPLNVNTINQTAGDVLGKQGANAGAFGRNKHVLTHYCDEEGIIMTLMCIVPIPVYSQMLHKSFLKSSPLDYYNHQFGKIGNQPITYEEVCPVQAYNEGIDVHDVFGYQRPWYHLISSYDEAHGSFRDNMSQFIQMRTFASAPELGADFLHIDESQLNDVFVIPDENVSDPYYGQIGFKIFKKTAIPRYSVPALE